MNILGIDQSISGTGVCIIDTDTHNIIHAEAIPTSNNLLKMLTLHPDFINYLDIPVPDLIDMETMKLTKKAKDLTEDDKAMLSVPQTLRMNYIVGRITKLLKEHRVVFAGIEGLSFGGAGRVIDLAKLAGRIHQRLDDMGVTYIEYPPTEIKKFAGKGNFSKEQMAEAVPDDVLETLLGYTARDRKGKPQNLEDIVDAYWIAKLTTQGLQMGSVE